MPAKDISRHLFQPKKHYASVRMQQGRVILDSDWNESESIDDEEARRSLLDIVGVRGAPGGGFMIALAGGASPQEPVDFQIAGGSYYVGGLRFSIEDTDQRYLTQDDWLRVKSPLAELLRVPAIVAGEEPLRTDLVYLRGWEQPVSAVEDPELRETALGGPDTSVRMRRMARVEVMTTEGDTCALAFRELIERERSIVGSNEMHEFDGDHSELRSAARLTVTFAGNGRTDNLCSPSVIDGFLGAENDTIRVQLTEPGRFVWGRDNASPLYRVKVGAGNDSIEFLTLPKDELAQPLMGQAVELLPWAAQLHNKEHVADAVGHLATVSKSYSGKKLSIAQPVPEAWLARQRELAGPGEDVYMYLRLWTGGSGDMTQPSHEVIVDEDIPLGDTGLTVRFSSFGNVGDHWIISARPSTPHKVVPWELMEGAAPVGPRQFLAPLALLQWKADGNEVTADVTDCRARFRPLTAQGGRCSVLVGDGVNSKGHLTSIQEAIDLLPAEGGKVCLLSGTFAQSFEIRDRKNITIVGNGLLTRIVNPVGVRGYDGPLKQPLPALIRVAHSQDIRLHNFAVASQGVFGIELVGGANLRDIHLHDLDLFALGRGTRARPDVMPVAAIHGLGGRHISISDCRVRMANLPSPFPAIYIEGTDIKIKDNVIVAGPHPDDAKPGRLVENPVFRDDLVSVNLAVMMRLLDEVRLPARELRPVIDNLSVPNIAPFGGIQVGGNSTQVLIDNNDILGGSGHGISLGSVHYLRSTVPPVTPPVGEEVGMLPGRLVAFAFGKAVVRVPIGLNGGAFFMPTFRLDLTPSRLTLPGSNVELAPMTGGSLSSITIRHNRIANHGGSGISTASFSGEPLLADSGGLTFVGPDMRLVTELQPVTTRAARRFSVGTSVERLARLRPRVGDATDVVVRSPVGETTGGTGTGAGGAAGARGNVGVIAVADLEIHDNDISSNNRLVASAGPNVVHGGIGLELAIDVSIRNNKIIGNGWQRSGSVAGIGILAGANVAITGNEIMRNGTVAHSRPDDMVATFLMALPPPVVQGGIVLGPIVASGNQDEDGIPASAGTAIRVQNNQVDQPFGKALWIHGALGPVKVEGNSLVTREDRSRVPAMAGLRFAFGSGPAMPATGACVQISTMAADPDDSAGQFGGEIIFHDNTVSLQRGGAIGALLVSFDDISMQTNQFRSAGPVVFNVIAHAGGVLQACNNRFREPSSAGPTNSTISLLGIARSVTAIAIGNAARHCVVMHSESVVQHGNHVERADECKSISASSTTGGDVVTWRVKR